MRTFWLVILFAFSFASCGTPNKSTSESWAYPFVQWNDHTYRITNLPVSTVGKQIGSIEKYSDREGNYSGNFSNVLPVGTKMFEIPDTKTTKAFAVENKDGSFVKVVFDH